MYRFLCIGSVEEETRQIRVKPWSIPTVTMMIIVRITYGFFFVGQIAMIVLVASNMVTLVVAVYRSQFSGTGVL